MIKKNRKIPLKILKLRALLRRLPHHHPKRQTIEEELAKSLAGYNGEKAVDYHLSFLPNEYMILHDLRIPDSEKRYFQIDTLILSTKYLLILEVKNISGTLIFDQKFHQLIRVTSEKEEGFPDPLLQVKRQRVQLVDWLTKNKFPVPPIITFIVISNPATIIKAGPEHAVVHAATLPNKIKQLEKTILQEKMALKELKKLASLLLKKHSSLNPNLLEKLGILPKEILTGVHCPACFQLPMVRSGSKWICPVCHLKSYEAHIISLHDYSLFFGTTITNQQFRNFLHISSISVASKLLASMELQQSGQNKGRKYLLELPEH